MMGINLDDIADFYSYFYSKIYGNPKYRLNYSDWQLNIATSFLKLLKSHYTNPDRRFLWNYCVHMFEIRCSQDIKGHHEDGRIQINMIFSESDFFSFYNRDVKFDFKFVDSDFLKQNKLKFSEVSERKVIKVANGFDYEEKLKAKFKAEDQLLSSCIEFTSLYKPDSQICDECQYKNDCKTILKDNFPELFKARIKG